MDTRLQWLRTSGRMMSELNDVGICAASKPFPPSHMVGIMWTLPVIIGIDSTIVLPTPKSLTAELADSILDSANVEYSCLPPPMVSKRSQYPAYLSNFAKLAGLAYTSGPLEKGTGDLVS